MLKWIKEKLLTGSGPQAKAVVPVETTVTRTAGHEGQQLQETGDQFFKERKFPEAERHYLQAIALYPEDASLHNKLGDAYYEQNKLAEAEKYYRQALLLQPDWIDASLSLGIVLDELGRDAEAEKVYKDVLARHPDAYLVCFNLAVTLGTSGRVQEAVSFYQKALEIKPEFFHAHFNLGTLFQRQQILDKAEFHYRRTIEVNPQHFAALSNLGVICKERRRYDDAESCFVQALRINGNYLETHNNLGLVYFEKNKLDAAVKCFQHVLTLKPDFADAHCNLGDVYKKQARLVEAEASYKAAIALRSDNPRYYCNLGILYHESGRYGEASAAYDQAYELDTGSLILYINMGHAYADRGMYREAEQSYRKALQIDPLRAKTYGDLLFLLNYDPDRSAEEIFAQYQVYDEKLTRPYQSEWQACGNDRNPARRLKIGYVSPDFRQHAVQFFLEPLLAHHDARELEIYAYAELQQEDQITARYKSFVNHFVPTAGLSDAALADRIRADGIDILVDLAGHTGSNRLQVFARRPAPIQVSWLGFGYTTGLQAMDYFLTDEICAPAGSEALFSEQVWRMTTPAFAYRPAQSMGEVNTLPALDKGHITLGTLTRSIRINHKTMRVWAAILKRLGGAKLLINSSNFQHASARRELEARFAALGIGSERLEIGFGTPPWDILRSIDIGLDCFPHNSGTTLFETLYMGIPYVTLAGRPGVGLLGSSILHGVQHPEWIAQSEEDYIEKVLALAGDSHQLARIRAGLRQEMQSSALMDEAGFARKVEGAYRAMWQKWCTAA